MSELTIVEYMAETGSRFSKQDAQTIGPVLNELSETGAVTPRDVVDAAASENSPLHPYFEWNNKKAADLYRVEQARNMLRSIRIKYTEGGGEPKIAKAFQVLSRSAYETKPREYRSFNVLHGDSAFAVQMMVSAFDDIQSWRRKYEPYADMWEKFGDAFQGVLNQIGEWIDETSGTELPEQTDSALSVLLDWRDQYADGLQTWTECREQLTYMIEAISEAEASFKALKIGPRECMSCGKTFTSAGPQNRMCQSCSGKAGGLMEAEFAA